MIECFHRQLKASLSATENVIQWSQALSLVLLGIRTDIKEDLGHSPSEMLYGENIPNEMFVPSNTGVCDSEIFVMQLKLAFERLSENRKIDDQKIFIVMPGIQYIFIKMLVKA